MIKAIKMLNSCTGWDAGDSFLVSDEDEFHLYFYDVSERWTEVDKSLEGILFEAIDPNKVDTDYGYLRTDDDGHWYLVPENEVVEFDNAMRRIEEDEDRDEMVDWFIRDFDKYRLSGGIQDLKVLME